MLTHILHDMYGITVYLLNMWTIFFSLRPISTTRQATTCWYILASDSFSFHRLPHEWNLENTSFLLTSAKPLEVASNEREKKQPAFVAASQVGVRALNLNITSSYFSFPLNVPYSQAGANWRGLAKKLCVYSAGTPVRIRPYSCRRVVTSTHLT